MFFQRLEECCKRRGIKPSALAEEFHTTRSVISGWKRGASPNSEFVSLAAKYFSVSADYLLGLSDSPYPASERIDFHSIDPALAAGLLASPELVRSTVLRIASAALKELSPFSDAIQGQPSFFPSHRERLPDHVERAIRPYPKQLQAASKRTGDRVWKGVEGKTAAGPPITTVPADDQRVMVPVKYTGEQYFLVQVEGDSMLGIVNDGDFCVLDKRGRFDDGRVVFVQADGPTDQPEATLKRIYRRAGGKVELRSENRKYPPLIYPAEEVQVMGELVAVLRPDCPPTA